ncbi:MAG: MFS transporter [Bacilli bacterium]
MNINRISFYIIGMGFASISLWMYLVALNLKILSLTNSPYAIGFLYIIVPASRILTNLWNGGLIDKYNKKTILLTINIIRSILIGLVCVFDDIVIIYLLTFLMGIVTAFSSPTSNVFIANNVEKDERDKFNSIMGSVYSGAMLTGPALAGMYINYSSINSCILLSCIFFIICAFFIAFIPNKEPEFTTDASSTSVHFLLRDSVYTLQFFKENKKLLHVFSCFYLSVLIGYALDSQEATYITFNLHATLQQYGFLVMVAGFGSLAASIYNRYRPSSIPTLISWSSILGAVCYLLFYLSSNYLWACVLFFVLGFCLTMASIGFATFFQNNVPAQKMGRVSAILELIQGVVQILLTLILGYFSEVFSLQVVTTIFGSIGVLFAFLLFELLRRNRAAFQ